MGETGCGKKRVSPIKKGIKTDHCTLQNQSESKQEENKNKIPQSQLGTLDEDREDKGLL